MKAKVTEAILNFTVGFYLTKEQQSMLACKQLNVKDEAEVYERGLDEIFEAYVNSVSQFAFTSSALTSLPLYKFRF